MPTRDELIAKIEALEAEQAANKAMIALLKASKPADLGFKVTARGAISMYGIQRFPLTFTFPQWKVIFSRQEALLAFASANDALLAVKGADGKYAVPTATVPDTPAQEQHEADAELAELAQLEAAELAPATA